MPIDLPTDLGLLNPTEQGAQFEVKNLYMAKAALALQDGLQPFSRDFFYRVFPLQEAGETIAEHFQRAIQHPTGLYLFFQRYTHFNAYTSAAISRLASSIALSRYLFIDESVPVVEESDRGFNIAAKVMIAASDEGTNDGAPHRMLAQLLLKTMGDYAGLSASERNQFAPIPAWLDQICQAVVDSYQGKPDDLAALVRSIGFHAASELLGDIEYALVDRVVRHDHRGTGFDQFLSRTPAVELCGHRYHPWCYVLVHSRHEGTGVEASHFECVVDALNMVVQYRPESQEQIMEWVLEGFNQFLSLEQKMFARVDRERQSWLQENNLAIEVLV